MFLFFLDVGLLYSFICVFLPAWVQDSIRATYEDVLGRLFASVQEPSSPNVAVPMLCSPRHSSGCNATSPPWTPQRTRLATTPSSCGPPLSGLGDNVTSPSSPLRQRLATTPSSQAYSEVKHMPEDDQDLSDDDDEQQSIRGFDLAFVCSSVVGVVIWRFCASMVALLGLTFFSHLLTYALVTARVCLVVLFIFF